MKDIVPELIGNIKTKFNEKRATDSIIQALLKKVNAGNATLGNGHDYAARLGDILSDVLQSEITEDVLPDGKMYWNIAERTVGEMLKQNHALVNNVAAQIQELIDQENGIGLAPIKGSVLEDRIKGLLDKICAEITFEDMAKWLGEPIVNYTESCFDDFIKANADFRNQVGFETMIVRTAAKGCCDWCSGLTGVYPYEEVSATGSDVFRRHENCRCQVTYICNKFKQDVWSKAYR